MKDGPGWKMYFPKEHGDIPASYVSLPVATVVRSGKPTSFTIRGVPFQSSRFVSCSTSTWLSSKFELNSFGFLSLNWEMRVFICTTWH